MPRSSRPLVARESKLGMVTLFECWLLVVSRVTIADLDPLATRGRLYRVVYSRRSSGPVVFGT